MAKCSNVISLVIGFVGGVAFIVVLQARFPNELQVDMRLRMSAPATGAAAVPLEATPETRTAAATAALSPCAPLQPPASCPPAKCPPERACPECPAATTGPKIVERAPLKCGKDCNKGLIRLQEMGFNPKRILDLGANKGNWARIQRQIFPEAHFLMLDGSDHKKDWPDLLKLPTVDSDIAIFDKEDHEVQWFGKGTTGDSIFKEVMFKGHGHTRKAYSLDNFLNKTRRSNVFDLVKMDVQGAELNVLKGASEVLKHAEAITLELPFAGVFNKGAPTFAEYISFLDGAGFTPFDSVEDHRMPVKGKGINEISGYLIQIDFVFVRKNSKYLDIIQHRMNTYER